MKSGYDKERPSEKLTIKKLIIFTTTGIVCLGLVYLVHKRIEYEPFITGRVILSSECLNAKDIFFIAPPGCRLVVFSIELPGHSNEELEDVLSSSEIILAGLDENSKLLSWKKECRDRKGLAYFFRTEEEEAIQCFPQKYLVTFQCYGGENIENILQGKTLDFALGGNRKSFKIWLKELERNNIKLTFERGHGETRTKGRYIQVPFSSIE